MKKIITLILTVTLLSSCFPTKEVISDNYEIDNELHFKILKYSEPTTKANFIRSEEAKYVDLAITMTNKSATSKEVSFIDFYIVNESGNMRSPLWKVNREIEFTGAERKKVRFEAFETKKLWLSFLAPKNEQIKFLYFNGKKVALTFRETKQEMF
jgi:hypothetical protein